MATKEQIEMVVERMRHACPAHFFKYVDEMQVGIGAALQLLYESEEEVTAGRISDVLKVSTARVAVLIKKMVSKGLVTKEQSARDARVTIVRLTDFGTRTVEEVWGDICQKIGTVIDTVGEERLFTFFSIAEEIENTVSPPKLHF